MKHLLAAASAAFLAVSLTNAAQAAPPRSSTYDKVKVCSNTTHDIQVVYDLIDYANGSGNKIVIAKGFTITRGPSVGTLGMPDSTLNRVGFTLIVGNNIQQTVIIDVRNGNNDRDFDNPLNYSVIDGCVLS